MNYNEIKNEITRIEKMMNSRDLTGGEKRVFKVKLSNLRYQLEDLQYDEIQSLIANDVLYNTGYTQKELRNGVADEVYMDELNIVCPNLEE